VERWAQAALGAEEGPMSAPLDLGPVTVPSRIVASLDANVDLGVGLGGLALAGAGLVMATSRDVSAADAVAWVHRNTEAAAGLRLPDDAGPEAAELAAQDDFDVLEVPLGSAAIDGWPAERTLMVVVPAPEDAEGSEADEILASLVELGRTRPTVVGVSGSLGGTVAEALLFCDRVVQETGLPTAAVDLLGDDDGALTAVLAGRVSLVQGMPSLASDEWGRGTGLQATHGRA
jgi:hypothetical protein